jgi:hypothetical protein
MLLTTGCTMTFFSLRHDLQSVINAFGGALVGNDPSGAMNHISPSYQDAHGGYYEFKRDLGLDLLAGYYLSYHVELEQVRRWGDQAWAVGYLTAIYRHHGDSAPTSRSGRKEWTFRWESYRWRITSQNAYPYR